MSKRQQSVDSESLLLNVAIIPPDRVSREAIDLSSKTHALGGIFELDRATRFPHMTIYMARFPRSAVNAAQKELSNLVPSLKEEILEHSGYYVTPIKYYEISYRKTPGLEKLQEMIARKLRGLRYAPENPEIENYFGDYTGDTKENVEKWGYDLFGSLYRPHVTLTRLPSETRIDSLGQLPRSLDDLSFSLSGIGLFQADDMGAARELITKWKLGTRRSGVGVGAV